jgi:hypothetical protein
LALYRAWPKVNWSLGGINPSKTLEEQRIIEASLYAWVVYGALITVSFSFYADRFYQSYTMN